ncbi:bidirectional sugar transporter SWEET3-like isoform X2 [Olea europaea var. sylvestris]|uniref:Bidirectional sugar transporter SWEET n=1 Tax=Olea europaea subsp. europaea TaxID=158383 RepID=A0A8S0U3V7_OLEEU|nr:bidirectional sugar transporter SWEET3-like isoform X2 [Olea europaea var. sylvestris]XP_022887051.1 bidirectional sugar transporter SWEET3-like isoform X2 [Olea europaea var. sylvestris]CAA3013182.1 bidirectional sugar transporter SWEET3-like [Olea europaea subsp. europaea]
MAERIRLAVGIMGNAASLLLYAAPVLTFSRVIRRKSTEEFSCVPYIIALSNCFLYTWYGLPIVSYHWENFPVVTINGLGILFELSFIAIYFYFASANGKKKVAMITIPVFVLFCIAAILSAFAFHDHHHRKAFIGSAGLVASIAMYGSPLVVMKQVIQTKSVEFMPFYLSFFSLLASSLWMAYGLLSHDLVLTSPNLVGTPLGILQLLLYCKYKKTGVIEEKPQKWELESCSDKSKQQLEKLDDEKLKQHSQSTHDTDTKT